MRFRIRGARAPGALVGLGFALSLAAAPAARANALGCPPEAVTVCFDDLGSGSAVSAADLGALAIGDALVLSEAAVGFLTGFDALGSWATSGSQGLLNTLQPEIAFDFGVAVTSFSVDVLGLPDELGDPTAVVLQAFHGDTLVGLDVSNVDLIGDSGFPEDTLAVADALGITRVVLFPGLPCDGLLCFEVGSTSTFWADTVHYEALPEPASALLLGAAVAGLALRRRRALPALLLGPALLVLGSCVPRPQIITPPDRSVVDPSQPIPVEVELGDLLAQGGLFRATLLAGIDSPPASMIEIPAADFTVVGTRVTTEIDPALLGEGRNTLFVSVDADADGRSENVTSSSFSYEPALDLASADRCDLLDPSLCLYPFPNDHFTREDLQSDTGRRVSFALESMPANAGGVHMDPAEWNRNDGFSPGSAVQTIVPGLVLETPSGDPALPPVPVPGAVPIWDVARSLEPDSSFVIVDAETGERKLLWAEFNAHATPTQPDGTPEPDPAVILRPAENLESGRRYIAALRNLRDASGDIIPPQRAFRLFRDGIPTYVPEIEERRAQMEQIFGELAQAGVARDDLHLAWDFTVISKRNVSERLLHMRDDAFAALGAAAPVFAVDAIEERPGDARIRRRVLGSFEVPLYLTNGGATGGPTGATRLYCEDALGAQKPCEGDELPVQSGVYSARFECVIPRSASQDGGDPVTPARPALYGHGLLGSEDEVGASHVAAMAFEHNFVFCATRWIGMAEEDEIATVGHILVNFGIFPTMADRLQQAMLNFLFLGRLMIHPDGFGSHAAFQAGAAGTPVIDGSELFYDGNSQGAIAGGALAAFAQDYTRAVLGVPGMNYSTLLLRSVDFDQFLFLFELSYPSPAARLLAVSLVQMLWDRSETNGHANHLTADTYAGTPPKKILLQVAFGDFQVADVSAEVEARTIGAHIHRPAFDPAAYIAENPAGEPRPFFQVNPYFGIPAIPIAPPAPPVPDAPGASYDFDGSAMIVWDSGNLQSPLTNTPPPDTGNPELSACALDHGQDPHECPRRQPSARVQKSHFLSTGGSVVDVCAGDVCLAPDP